MKRSIYALALMTLLGACGKKTVPLGHIYSGRIVQNVCGNIAIQVTDGSALGETWRTSSGVTTTHAFKVADPCTWRPKGGTSNEIQFIFVPPAPQTCAQCLLAAEMPATEYHIQVVE